MMGGASRTRLALLAGLAVLIVFFVAFKRPASSTALWPAGRNGQLNGRTSGGPDVVVYNRIPKTGSTSLMHLPYKLYKENSLNVMFVNISGSPSSYTMNLRDQEHFVRNITGWTERFPAIYHGHFAYVDVDKFGGKFKNNVAYINVVRRPIERFVSYYYFLRYGDDFRVNKVRSRMGDKVTFDECVAKKPPQPDCDPRKLWLQVPWFCGHARRCWSPPGNAWALDRAKANLIDKYWLVGVTDELEAFVDILEWVLPDFFKGAGDLYRKEGAEGGKNHIRKTKHKDPPSEETLAVLQATKAWKAENEFYEFALAHFKAVKDEYAKAKAAGGLDNLYKEHFHYDKVRGPS